MRGASKTQGVFEFIGEASIFGFRAFRNLFSKQPEFRQMWLQVEEIGWRSLPLVLASGLALGIVLTLHTRSSLVQFGAQAMIPSVQSFAFFNEIGPLVTGLLVSGRVGAGIGAQLAELRATEQIDALEVLSLDSFNLLVVPRIVACIIAMPLLTAFMDFVSLLGGFISETVIAHISFRLYVDRAFSTLEWSNFAPPTLKTAVFGLIIGVVSSYFGYTTNEGATGVGKAATNSVVVSSLLIILVDVVLVKAIFFLFPDSAI